MKFAIAAKFALVLLTGCASQSSGPSDPRRAAMTQYEQSPAIDPFSKYWERTDEGKRHALSGVHCLDSVDEFSLTDTLVYRSIPQGLDVSCKYESPNLAQVTIYLAYKTTRPSAKRHFKEAVQAATQLVPAFDDAETPTDTENQPITKFGKAYSITPVGLRILSDDEIFDTAILLEPVGSWHVKFRATYPRSEKSHAEALIVKLLAQAREELSSGLMYQSD